MNMKRRAYEVPLTRKMQVEVESGFCVVASGKESTIKKDESTIEVEEYKEINNEISFD